MSHPKKDPNFAQFIDFLPNLIFDFNLCHAKPKSLNC